MPRLSPRPHTVTPQAEHTVLGGILRQNGRMVGKGKSCLCLADPLTPQYRQGRCASAKTTVPKAEGVRCDTRVQGLDQPSHLTQFDPGDDGC